MSIKVPYPILALEVDRLYSKDFDPSNIKGINEHCEFIAEFIKSAGYSEEEYIRLMFEFDNQFSN